ncbi:hypothetical protein C6Y39_16070 [Alteromonas gracilis]|uniref:Uncharacterized protein n=1 Tax=Alteromonas gracilis TaxID=1479524 RepID=A0ABX5CNM4_9ALTE|nr:hypothetical protein C6Y39_16070 [Alteromonas gracilis]
MTFKICVAKKYSKLQARMMNRNIEKQIQLIVQIQGEKNNGLRVVTLTPLFFGYKKRGLSFHSGPFF